MEQRCPIRIAVRNASLVGSGFFSFVVQKKKVFPNERHAVAGSNRVFYLTFIVIIN